jgi:hypothetical protein
MAELKARSLIWLFTQDQDSGRINPRLVTPKQQPAGERRILFSKETNMNQELLDELEKLIEYCWEDEEEDWEACDRPENHIFVTIKKLNDYLADAVQPKTKESDEE